VNIIDFENKFVSRYTGICRAMHAFAEEHVRRGSARAHKCHQQMEESSATGISNEAVLDE
jgi:hypothetical protein